MSTLPANASGVASAYLKGDTMQLQHGDSFPFVQNSRTGDLKWCQVCGRALGESGQYWVEVFDGGDIWDEVTHGEPDRTDAGWMGKYPVGIACAKKFAPSVLVWEASN